MSKGGGISDVKVHLQLAIMSGCKYYLEGEKMIEKSKLIGILCCTVLLLMILVLAIGCAETDDTAAEPDLNGEDTDGEPANGAEYKFALVHGALHPYFDPMTQAARDAERDFGLPEVTITAPQNWDQPEQNVIFDGLVARGYNGVATMMSEPVAGNIQLNKMIAEGVHIIVYGGPPDTPTDVPFYLATDSYDSAYQATKIVIEALGGEGDIVHLAGMVVEANVVIRMEAVEEAVSEYPGINLIQTIADLDVVENAERDISALLAARRGDIDGIVSTSYIPTMVLADSLVELDAKEIIAVGIDTDPIVLDAIRSGHMYGTMSQNPYGQAYLSLYSLKLFVDGYTWDGPFHVDSGTFLISNENVDAVDESLAIATQELLEDWKDKYFKPPAQ